MFIGSLLWALQQMLLPATISIFTSYTAKYLESKEKENWALALRVISWGSFVFFWILPRVEDLFNTVWTLPAFQSSVPALAPPAPTLDPAYQGVADDAARQLTRDMTMYHDAMFPPDAGVHRSWWIKGKNMLQNIFAVPESSSPWQNFVDSFNASFGPSHLVKGWNSLMETIIEVIKK
jgi:hypothetical protein